MTDYPYEGEVQLLGYAWNPDDGPWIRIRLDEIAEMSGGPHPFNGLKKGREKGQRLRMRFDLIADDETTTGAPAEPAGEQPASEGTETPQEPERSTAGWSEAKRKMVMRSGIVRKEAAFQDFLAAQYPDLWRNTQSLTPEIKAAEVIHSLCGVESCRDLGPDDNTGASFREIMRGYEDPNRGYAPDALETQRDGGPG